MRWLFNFLYLLFFLLASPWMLWRIIQGKNRRGWLHKFLGLVPRRTQNGNCVWMHAVSVGEVNLLRPVIDELLAKEPDLQIAISTSTETGFDLANEKYSQHQVFFCPHDFSWAIKNTFKRINPNAIILAELELWPNLISVADKLHIPVIVINGRISDKSHRGYLRFKDLTTPMFRRLSMVLAQTKTYADRFIDLGCDATRVSISGSVKFDGVTTNPDNPQTQRLANEAGFSPDDFVFVAGSTQLEEDLIAAEVFVRLRPEFPNLKLVLVPRHPNRCQQLEQQLKQSSIEIDLRSELSADRDSSRPLVLDQHQCHAKLKCHRCADDEAATSYRATV